MLQSTINPYIPTLTESEKTLALKKLSDLSGIEWQIGFAAFEDGHSNLYPAIYTIQSFESNQPDQKKIMDDICTKINKMVNCNGIVEPIQYFYSGKYKLCISGSVNLLLYYFLHLEELKDIVQNTKPYNDFNDNRRLFYNATSRIIDTLIINAFKDKKELGNVQITQTLQMSNGFTTKTIVSKKELGNIQVVELKTRPYGGESATILQLNLELALKTKEGELPLGKELIKSGFVLETALKALENLYGLFSLEVKRQNSDFYFLNMEIVINLKLNVNIMHILNFETQYFVKHQQKQLESSKEPNYVDCVPTELSVLMAEKHFQGNPDDRSYTKKYIMEM